MSDRNGGKQTFVHSDMISAQQAIDHTRPPTHLYSTHNEYHVYIIPVPIGLLSLISPNPSWASHRYLLDDDSRHVRIDSSRSFCEIRGDHTYAGFSGKNKNINREESWSLPRYRYRYTMVDEYTYT